jgi:hypothetical protein
MMVNTAPTQCSWVSNQMPISFKGNNGTTGTMNTISVIAGDKASTRSASHCLNARSGISATHQATIGSR